MSVNKSEGASPLHSLKAKVRPDVLAGLMFMSIAGFGLWISNDYPIGTAVRMGTGYVPRLFLWILFGLGVVILVLGLRGSGEEGHDDPPLQWRPLLLIPASQAAFALMISDYGIIVAGVVMVLIGGAASNQSRWLEVLISAVVLVAAVWVIFVYGLGLVIPVWPGD